MIELKNKTAHWWQRRSGRIVAEFDAVCVCAIIAILTVPALAATAVPVPFTNVVIDIGDVPPWIAAMVLAVTWWEARSARKEARTAKETAIVIGTKVDGMLVDRDKAKVAEGERRGEKAGAAAAEQLAEGQRRGIEIERASVAAQGATTGDAPAAAIPGKQPLPVADERTAEASERVATATERSAAATVRVADATEVNLADGKK